MKRKGLPRLVIVSGASATGKTSTARELAAELGLALLAKDDLKEGLFDTLGNPRGETESLRLEVASLVLLERLGRRILEIGSGLVVEGNFARGTAEAHLGPLVARSRAVLLHFEVDPEVMARRIKKRLEGKKKRHPGHEDAAANATPELEQLLEEPEKLIEARPDLEPPVLDIPVKRVNTSENKNPDIARLARWVEKSTQPRN